MLPILRNMCQATGLCCVAMWCRGQQSMFGTVRERKKQAYWFPLIHPEIFRTRLRYTSNYLARSHFQHVKRSRFTRVGREKLHRGFFQSTISTGKASPSPQVDSPTVKQLYFSARTFMKGGGGGYLICCLAPGPVGAWLDYYVNACASCPLLSPSWPRCR